VLGTAACPLLLASWRWGGGWWRVPTSALIWEDDSHLLGVSHGAATSPPPLGVDLRPWWLGIGRRGHLSADPTHALVEGCCVAHVNAFSAMRGVRSAIFGGVHAFFYAWWSPRRGKWHAASWQGGSSLGGAVARSPRWWCGALRFTGSSLGGRLVPASKCAGSSMALAVWHGRCCREVGVAVDAGIARVNFFGLWLLSWLVAVVVVVS
jgi:hypothetical protein